MLRTNQSFLSYTKELYEQQVRKSDIIVKNYSKGQLLFTQEEQATKIMVIAAGISKCYFTESNDKAFILEFLGTGEIVGEVEYLRKINSLCTIEAITDVTVYAFSISYFQDLLKKDFYLNELLLNVLAERIVNTSRRASYQQLYTVQHSLMKLLDLQAQQAITITKSDMADYLGISVRSLNRELKNITP